MNSELKHIKQLINSKNNQNLYMGFYMLKNYKKYEKGEFKEVFKQMFIHTKKVFKLNIEHEVCISFRCYGDNVFSYNIKIGNIKNEKKKQIPMEYYNGTFNACIVKVINFIESFLQTDFK